MSKPILKTGASAPLAAAAMLALGACAMAPTAGATPAVAGASIEPPAGQQLAALEASGVQIYSCEFNAQHQLRWSFKRPSAMLYDASGRQVVLHGAGPSWEAGDGSRVVGRALAQKPSDTPGSIPQLLLETHGTGGAGMLAEVRYVQRLNTVGGLAPSAPCASEHQEGSTPYLARYVFYR